MVINIMMLTVVVMVIGVGNDGNDDGNDDIHDAIPHPRILSDCMHIQVVVGAILYR